MTGTNDERIKQLKKKYELLRQLKILKCRQSFWEYQKIVDGKSFKDERTYLLISALCLQSFYQDVPVSYETKLPTEYHQKLDTSDCTIDIEFEETESGTIITVDCSGTDILIFEVPPRHHKSHTLINFEDWIFGQDPKQILITGSYNSVLANEFSQYVRDGIEQTRIRPTDIIYSDIFPYTRTKYGDRSKQRWSLEGSFLSYTGAGILSGVTGKGGNLVIFDDPIKGSLEAFNENHLDKVWQSYTNTWLSRLEQPRKQILVMTPWIEGDPGDRIIKGAEESGEVVKILNFKAYSEKQGMLCDEILDKRAFDILSSRLDPIILSGNYLCNRLGLKGKLYASFNTYKIDELPKKFDEIYCYVDTADEGKDYLAAGFCGIIREADEFGLMVRKAYMFDVYYTQDGMEITEPGIVDFLIENYGKVNTRSNRIGMTCMIESNNGGRGFARNVERLLKQKNYLLSRGINIKWFHQTENKKARINSQSNTVVKYVYFPADWKTRNKHWVDYSTSMIKYSKEGNNANDDAQDMTTGIAEKINTELSMFDAIGMRR